MKTMDEKIEQFLAPWKKKPGYVGALLTGSYAVGTQNEFSDIDIHIVYANGTDWRERGNVKVGGLLFEYFANPVSQYRAYMTKEFANGKNHTARMFVVGKILEDTTGDLSLLKKEGAAYLKKKLQKTNKIQNELAKYSIWDSVDELQGKEGANFTYLYALAMNKIFESYCEFLGVEKMAPSKVYRYFTDAKFRKNYRVDDFPDSQFSKFFVRAFDAESLGNIQKLATHTQKMMGGFDIDGWKLKTKIEV
jgi:predicted nucleotidyltransferase